MAEQIFYDIELILVDDGIPDGCPIICYDFARIDSWILVVHKVNGRLLSVRNERLKHITGEYPYIMKGEYVYFVGLWLKNSDGEPEF